MSQYFFGLFTRTDPVSSAASQLPTLQTERQPRTNQVFIESSSSETEREWEAANIRASRAAQYRASLGEEYRVERALQEAERAEREAAEQEEAALEIELEQQATSSTTAHFLRYFCQKG